MRYGLRALKNNPGFSAVAILTAALGIGANTSIFSVVHAVLLRPLPYKDAGQLISPIYVSRDNFIAFGIGDFQYATWRDQARVFDGIAAYSGRRFTISGNGEAEQLKAQAVTPGFLRVLGVSPLIGRDFVSTDSAPRGGKVAIISHSLWMRRFGGDPSILSRPLTLDGATYSIAGVLPPEFEFPENSEISLLIALSEPPAQPGGVTYFYSVIARLKEDISTARAQDDLALLNKNLESTYPRKFNHSIAGATTQVVGLHDRLVGNVQPALLVLSGAVGLVLLIVCLNICHLLLSRAIQRQKEMAVRLALGASRLRMLRQLLTEGMLLASAGGVAGLGLAFLGVKLLRAIAPSGVPHIENAHISGAVLAFNIGIAFCTGILFGLAPLRGSSSIDPEAALKRTSRNSTGGKNQRRLENLLIVSETAFALVLLAGAGLLLRTFAGLTSIAPGFAPESVYTARVSLPHWKYPTVARRRAFFDELQEKVRTGPGVQSIGGVACLPYGGYVMTGAIEIEGKPSSGRGDGADSAENVAVNFATGDYFRVMGIPLLEGRPIDVTDRAGRPSVAVVNQVFARTFFPSGGAIGARIRINGVTDWLQIAGVVGSVKQGGLASVPRPEIFQSPAQSESGGSASTLAIRSSADSQILVPWLRSAIASLDGDIPPPEIETMEEKMASLVASQLFVMRLQSLFAAIAISLAAIGIYSVLICSVSRRTHEIGIRMALGAKQAHIMSLILGRGLRLSILGAVFGTAGSLALTRYLKTLLYGVTPYDPATLATGCLLVILVAVGAAYLPARRAVRQDPFTTLRSE